MTTKSQHTLSFLRWSVKQADFLLIATLFLIVLSCTIFLWVADSVQERGMLSFDAKLLKFWRDPEDLAHPIGPPWLLGWVRDLTALGSVLILTLLTILVTVFLILKRNWPLVGFLLVAVLSGTLLLTTLKGVYDRARPDVVPHLATVTSASFPSGHSTMSAVIYLTLGTLIARASQRRALKVYFVAVAILLTLLIGWSRVYLGVHYPSDVLAGWCLGLGWALLVGVISRWIVLFGRWNAMKKSPASVVKP